MKTVAHAILSPVKDEINVPIALSAFRDNPLTRCRVPVLVHVRVWVHIPGDPQDCSAEERYNNN